MSWDWSAATKARMSGELFALKAFAALALIFMVGSCLGLIERSPQPIRATPPPPQTLTERDAEVRAMVAQREAQAKAAREESK